MEAQVQAKRKTQSTQSDRWDANSILFPFCEKKRYVLCHVGL